MHPNAAFAWPDPEQMMRFVAGRAFAHIFATGSAGPKVIHAPVIVTATGQVQFHLARRNRAAGELADQAVLISVSGRDAYHSANWYQSADQVPTWLYEAVEIEGAARRLEQAELVAHLDRLSATMERRFSPDRPWTRDKMTPGKFEAITKAIVGFEVVPTAVRGTRKFNQHKSSGDLAATIAGQQGAGRDDIVAAIRDTTRP